MTVDLFARPDIIGDDVMAALDAHLAGPTSRSVTFGEGYRINPAAMIASHPFARALMGEPWADEAVRRAIVRAAVLPAEPERICVSLRSGATPPAHRSTARMLHRMFSAQCNTLGDLS